MDWRETVEARFCLPVANFMVEVVWLLGYLDCFPECKGMVDADDGSDFCFVKVNTVSGNYRMLCYH